MNRSIQMDKPNYTLASENKQEALKPTKRRLDDSRIFVRKNSPKRVIYVYVQQYTTTGWKEKKKKAKEKRNHCNATRSIHTLCSHMKNAIHDCFNSLLSALLVALPNVICKGVLFYLSWRPHDGICHDFLVSIPMEKTCSNLVREFRMFHKERYDKKNIFHIKNSGLKGLKKITHFWRLHRQNYSLIIGNKNLRNSKFIYFFIPPKSKAKTTQRLMLLCYADIITSRYYKTKYFGK